MAKWRSIVSVSALVLTLTAGFVVYVFWCCENYYRPAQVVLKLEISLLDTTLGEVIAGDKDTTYEAFAEIRDQGIYDSVELKGRGNSTWGLEKSPFQIKFSEKTELFGLGKAKKWVLLANFFDSSQLRTEAAFYLERLLGEQFAFDGRFVELIIDDEDVGLYYLAPKVEVDKSRVDLREPLGILMEYDNLNAKAGECVFSEQGSCMVIKDVVTLDFEDEAVEQFMDAFDALETAAKEGDYETVKEVADVESLVIYYLLSEFSSNPDCYASSMYFYKDGADDKIHAGPGWDYDYAFGNLGWNLNFGDEFYSPYADEPGRIMAFGGTYVDRVTGDVKEAEPLKAVSKLFYRLMEIPEFNAEVGRIYRERMFGKKDEMIRFLSDQGMYIDEQAFNNNELYGFENYREAKWYLIDWISKRYDFFDDKYGGLDELIQRQI